jgi:hypothetical protein
MICNFRKFVDRKQIHIFRSEITNKREALETDCVSKEDGVLIWTSLLATLLFTRLATMLATAGSYQTFVVGCLRKFAIKKEQGTLKDITLF